MRDTDWEHHEVNTELILMEELVMKLLRLVERLLETRWESWCWWRSGPAETLKWSRLSLIVLIIFSEETPELRTVVD